MKKLKKILLSPATTIVAFALAAGLLLFSSVGGARAALTYFSETYSSRVQMYDIGVTLRENGQDISWRKYGPKADGSWAQYTGVLVGLMLDEDEKLILGKPYMEELSVRNSGTINQYVRVSIYRYWLDENGHKVQSLSPDYINLHFVNLGSAWLEDESARTPERTVLYYNSLLNAGEETPLFADKLTIDGAVATLAEYTVLPDGTVHTVFTYNGARFCLEARVDAVQENNASDAILSAWGRNVSAGGGLSLR